MTSSTELTGALAAYREALEAHRADVSTISALAAFLDGLAPLSVKEARKLAPKALAGGARLCDPFEVRAGGAQAALARFAALAKGLGAKPALLKEVDELTALLDSAPETGLAALAEALTAEATRKTAAAAKRATRKKSVDAV